VISAALGTPSIRRHRVGFLVQYARRAASIPEHQTRQEVEQHLFGTWPFYAQETKNGLRQK
jgi:hypothetical protein